MNSRQTALPSIEVFAEDALLLRWGDTVELALNAQVLAAAARLRQALPALECVSAYASLLLRFDPLRWPGAPAGEPPHAVIERAVREVLAQPPGADSPGRLIELPVLYGGEAGVDLSELAAHSGLEPAELVARHCAVEYRVAMLGFAPGFAYLLGLDPQLAMPRLAEPRLRVPAGSVAIGGQQTGIYPRELPGGWRLLGRTPARLFDPARAQPSLLRAGDRVRFRPLADAAAFARLAGEAST